jgi:HK97 family phage major capsid protein
LSLAQLILCKMRTIQMNEMKTGTLNRHMNFERDQVDEETRTVTLSFSSEAPVERFFGTEVLSHSPEAVDLTRLNARAALLGNHDLNDQIGVIESARIENGRGIATVRFSKSERGELFFRDLLDGIRSGVSVGYTIEEMQEKSDRVFEATRWSPHEISMVSTPADFSVGVSRSDAVQGDNLTRVIKLIKEDPKMEDQKIDIETVRNEAREAVLKEEQLRVRTINEMAKDAPYLRELADKALNDGFALDHFQREAFEATKKELARKPEAADIASPLNVDLSRSEKESYSLLRAISASASGDWSKAGLEKEISETIAQRSGASNGGFYMPSDMAWGRRDLTVGTNNAGGFLVGTEHDGASFIDALRAAMVTTRLGARVMSNLQGNVAIPKLSTGTSTYWVAEDGAPTEGQPVFASVSLTPKNLASFVQISRNLLVQSDPSVEAVIQDDITKAIAVAIDAAALAGTGSSNQPTGILATTGIGSVSFSSAGAPTFAEIVAIESAISADNAMGANMAFVTTPALAGVLKTTTKDSGSGRFVSEENSIMGYSVNPTSSMTANTILLGDFSQLMIAQFGAIEVITERNAQTGQLTLGLHAMVDVGVRHAESFAKGA